MGCKASHPDFKGVCLGTQKGRAYALYRRSRCNHCDRACVPGVRDDSAAHSETLSPGAAQTFDSSTGDCSSSAAAVSASSALTCNLRPRVIGHSSLETLVSARKHSTPAESRQPCANNASDMFPNRRIVTSSSGASWSFEDCIQSSLSTPSYIQRQKKRGSHDEPQRYSA